jgi:RluA family pseudouridine synthase
MLEIIYEDDVLVVCNKPAGLMVEPDRNNFPNLQQHVKNYLREKHNEKLPYAQHLHRIDRVVSGIVLFTKQRDCLNILSNQFAQRTVKKSYLALTHLAPKQSSATLIQWHRKEKKKAVIVPEGTEYAEQIQLNYSCEPFQSSFLWHINLHTGKYHQIRVQLAHLGCPIIGDSLYGSTLGYKENTIALHASELEIKHPKTGAILNFKTNADFGGTH